MIGGPKLQNRSHRTLQDGSLFATFQAINCLATIVWSLRDNFYLGLANSVQAKLFRGSFYLLLAGSSEKSNAFITSTTRGTHDQINSTHRFLLCIIGCFSQNHLRLRFRIKRQVPPMGSGMSESKDCDFSWRGKKTSKGTRVITTGSTLLRSISRRCYLYPRTSTSTRTRTKENQRSATPALQYSVLPIRLSFVTSSLHFSRFKARHDQY